MLLLFGPGLEGSNNLSCTERQCVEITQRGKGEAMTHKTNLMQLLLSSRKQSV